MGYMQQETEKYTEALDSFGQAKAILQKLAEAYPAVSRFEGDLAQSDQGIGSIRV